MNPNDKPPTMTEVFKSNEQHIADGTKPITAMELADRLEKDQIKHAMRFVKEPAQESETPTPRTDAHTYNFAYSHPLTNLNQPIVKVEFARTLEKELTAMTERAERAENNFNAIRKGGSGWFDDLNRQNEQLRAELDEARKTIQNYERNSRA